MLILLLISEFFVVTSFAYNKDLLPQLFYYNDTEECPNDKYFCKFNIKLRPIDEKNPSDTWKAIEEISNDGSYLGVNYDRRMIFRGYCLDNIENPETVNKTDLELKGLTSSIEASFCTKRVDMMDVWDATDVIFFSVFAVYVVFFLYCSYKSYEYSKKHPEDYNLEKFNKYMRIFSTVYTWRKLTEKKRNEDFNKLISIQGLRTTLMLFTVIGHSHLSYTILFSLNPEVLENFFLLPGVGTFLTLIPMYMQGFFVISSWLLAVQLCNIVKRNGEITLKDISILVLNRYFRLMPAVIFMTFIYRSKIATAFVHPLYLSFLQRETENCRNYWYLNYILIQNWTRAKNCNCSTWFIAADFQLYCLMLIAFYSSRKFKISLKYIFGAITSIALAVQFTIAVAVDFDPNVRWSLRLINHSYAFENLTFLLSYISTYSQVASYVIGFVFGMIYFERKHQNIFDTTAKKLFWLFSFLGTPYLLSVFYMKKYSKPIEILKAITFRPLFGLGMAIGILGMATNTGGIIKKILEWKPLVFIGDFTYCIYIFHFGIVFMKFSYISQMVSLNNFDMFLDAFISIPLSILVGMLMFFVLEFPCVLLQYAFLPQLKIKRKSEENQTPNKKTT